MVARGDIWWAEYPAHGRRPHLILTRDEAIPVLRRVLAAPLTRQLRGIPTEVVVDRADGVPWESAISLDNVAAVPTSLLVERITTLSPHRMAEVCEALRFAVAC